MLFSYKTAVGLFIDKSPKRELNIYLVTEQQEIDDECLQLL